MDDQNPSFSSDGNAKCSETASPVTGSSQNDGGALDVNTNNNVAMNGSVTDILAKKSAFDFADEIRRLEIEGDKLRSATISSLSNHYLQDGVLPSVEDGYPSGLLPNLSPFSQAVFDISTEQKTITDLRIQLESQRKETARLQHQLLGDVSSAPVSSYSYSGGGSRFVSSSSSNYNNNASSSSPSPSMLPSYPNTNGVVTTSSSSYSNPPITSVGGGSNLSNNGGGMMSSQTYSSPFNMNMSSMSSSSSPLRSNHPPAFSTIPSCGDIVGGNGFMIRKTFDLEPPPSHLERSLKETQEQLIGMKKRLQEANDLSDQQKKQFRTTIEELKSKLHETVMNRDTVLDLRQKESKQQDLLLEKLQSSLNQLQEQYKIQEEALVAASRKLDSQSQHHFSHETTVNQLRSILVDRERRRGKSYFDADTASSQGVSMLAHTLERCFQELDHEMNVTKYKLSGYDSELEQLKKVLQEKERKAAQELENRIKAENDEAVKKVSCLSVEHDKNMALAMEQVKMAKQQLAEFQSQIYDKETHHVVVRQEKESRIQELEDRLEEQKRLLLEERAKWQEKRVALEVSMDEIQKELVETKGERNDFIQKHTCLESQLADVQSLVSRHEADLATERERVREQRSREEELRTQCMNLETQLSHKQSDLERLEKMVDSVKQECSLQVVDKIANVERLERDRYLDQIKSLSGQLATMTERCNRVTVEHQMSKSEMDALRSQVIELTAKMDKARAQFESALIEKNELTSMLGNKSGDLERLIRDKDHFSQLAKEQLSELRELKTFKANLAQQLEEKEKVLSAFSQQSSSINQLMEVHSRSNDNIREEKEKLAEAFDQKSLQCEELKSTLEATNRKLKTREKRIRDLEEERLKLNEELVIKSQELDALQQEKDGLLTELKQSRLEVAGLSSSKDTLKKELQRLKNLRTREINKLQTKLKESEQENRLSQKALRSKDLIDQKAVRFADRAQREVTVKRSEVDILSSKMNRLEEKLQTVTKEKSMVEKDKESLKKSLAKSLLHTHELTDELQTTQVQNQELVRRVAELEMSADKANFKSSAATAQLEKCEQDMAMVKIKHQLDLKEAERQFVRGAQTGFYNINHGSSSSLASSLPPSMLPERDLNPQPLGTVGTSSDCNSNNNNNNNSGRRRSSHTCGVDTASVSGTGSSERSNNTLEIRDKRHREYSEVGRDLKNLLSDMRNLITNHRESEEESNSNFRSALVDSHSRGGTKHDVPLTTSDTDQTALLSARSVNLPLRMQDLRQSKGNLRSRESSPRRHQDLDKSWASRSFSELDTLSDFSIYKDWQPRSQSLTRHKSWASDLDLDSTRNVSAMSKPPSSIDLSNLSHSPDKDTTSMAAAYTSAVPDTRELCRRLEDKINSLTRMGGNLQKENREMASLIDRQGEKLDTVKQNEKKARGVSR